MSIIGKILLLIFIALTFILAGCQGSKELSSDFPPEPPSVGKATLAETNLAGMAFTVPEGYAPPYDVFYNNMDIVVIEPDFLNLGLEEDSFTITISATQSGGYVYKKGYYHDKNLGWTLFNFDGEVIGSSNWIREGAFKDLELSKKSIEDRANYIVAYSCKKYNNAWRCGCKTVNGPCNMWMLQKFDITLEKPEELPPEPDLVPGNQTKPGCGLLDNKCSITCPTNQICVNVSSTTGCGGICQPITGCGPSSVCTSKCPTGYYCYGAFPGGCGGVCKQNTTNTTNTTGCGYLSACQTKCPTGYYCSGSVPGGCKGTCIQNQTKTGCGIPGVGCSQTCSTGYYCYNITTSGCGGICINNQTIGCGLSSACMACPSSQYCYNATSMCTGFCITNKCGNLTGCGGSCGPGYQCKYANSTSCGLCELI